ncbi:prolyl-tRNA synthetase [Mycoplasmoides fastidiosum]|uniref:Proline--tRNA ligase n=1 Tax=Mycoplasmoides fastidiosum TaxID=92758 RepID=A0ABU0LZD6_9BACT|nr:proline--tRNA ligase [Mycoplasmoides fastidiosum]MDQ0514052.1 prolyl-tRNA synthetase [Mycoplasmoides fastidiosum]UUD37537.1 proline--tRNA ligase [Mycoplasmoides fastidiosum]
MNQSRIKNQAEDFSGWYESVVENAKLAQPGLVKGTILILPHAWAIWEQIQFFINQKFQQLGISNVGFPSFLTHESLAKEKDHVAGFAPELFLVYKSKTDHSHSVILRPTSEITFCHYFKTNLQSYNQLPMQVNQWCNVFRAEKNTKAFLRTSEFYWQELHTIHATATEAHQMVADVFNIYQECLRDYLNIGFLAGQKTILEKFAGADATYTLESFMPDGQMLQSCTAHYLGTNFTKPFEITFNSQNNEKTFPFQTSAGISTRILGAIIMSHGDNFGLVLPFDVAPHQIAVLNLVKNSDEQSQQFLNQLNNLLKNYRVKTDHSNKSFGFKIQTQELLGTPFSLVVGQKEIAENQVVVIDRLDREKTIVPLTELNEWLLQKIQWYKTEMYNRSYRRLVNAVVECQNWEQVITTVKAGKIALAPWFNDKNNEENFKAAQTGFSIRCIKNPLENNATTVNSEVQIPCVFSQQPANCWVYFARSY